MTLLTCEGITKSFLGVKALSDVSVSVAEGETLGIIGPNGSGKTTFFNILSGLERLDAGRIRLDGRDITRTPPHRISAQGIARTFQNLRLFGGMTALENVLCGGHKEAPTGIFGQLAHTRSIRLAETGALARARARLAEVGLAGYETAFVTQMSYGQTKRLELARALNASPRVLLLDEPTAGMNDAQAAEILDVVARMRDRHALTLVVIEHNVPVLARFADRIVVLDAGCKLVEGPPEEVVRDRRVVEAYLGKGAA